MTAEGPVVLKHPSLLTKPRIDVLRVQLGLLSLLCASILGLGLAFRSLLKNLLSASSINVSHLLQELKEHLTVSIVYLLVTREQIKWDL